ncbi:MAG: ATP-binding cassette domain-containing protein, partial [Firmicutes bacterium]|nr:ATP-binding cassette domain-containing protein [Bacillota bacterium]
ENGAGKSTLLRVLSTILKPTEGSAEIEGFDLIKNPKKVRQNIGILFGSEAGLYDRLTVRENIEFFARLYGLSKTQASGRVDRLSEIFAFKEFENKIASTLSKGMRQKVTIARSVIHDPKVMLFDEPDSGLDFKASKIFFEFLENCKQKKKSVIFSSHSMENIKLYSDKVVVIREGKIVGIFDANEKSKKFSAKEYNQFLYNLICDGEVCSSKL